MVLRKTMNLRPAFFSPALRAVLPVLWGLVLASGGVAAAATARVDKSDKLDRTDEAVLQVRDAFRVGNAATMAAVALGKGSTTTSMSSLSIAFFISRPRDCEFGACPQ